MFRLLCGLHIRIQLFEQQDILTQRLLSTAFSINAPMSLYSIMWTPPLHSSGYYPQDGGWKGCDSSHSPWRIDIQAGLAASG